MQQIQVFIHGNLRTIYKNRLSGAFPNLSPQCHSPLLVGWAVRNGCLEPCWKVVTLLGAELRKFHDWIKIKNHTSSSANNQEKTTSSQPEVTILARKSIRMIYSQNICRATVKMESSYEATSESNVRNPQISRQPHNLSTSVKEETL